MKIKIGDVEIAIDASSYDESSVFFHMYVPGASMYTLMNTDQAQKMIDGLTEVLSTLKEKEAA